MAQASLGGQQIEQRISAEHQPSIRLASTGCRCMVSGLSMKYQRI
jgi:hypothetical protein